MTTNRISIIFAIGAIGAIGPGWSAVAAAQPAGSAQSGTSPAPPVMPADQGAAQGTGPTGAPATTPPSPPTTPTPAKPTVLEVDCKTSAPTATVTTTDGTNQYTIAYTTKYELKEIAVGDVVKFQISPRFNVAADPKDSDVGLAVPAATTRCLQFTASGKFGFHSETGGFAGTVVVKQWYDILADYPIQEQGTFWLPKSVNLASDESDTMFYAALALSIFFFTAITAAVIYLTIKYRHRPGHKAEPSPAHHDALEITWTVIPTIITVFLFWYGWRSYIHVVTPPNKAVEIDVLAWRWNWQFTHANGVTDSDLHVPVNMPVRLVMTSKDVLHSFYAPAMRVKQDVVPRRFTYAWFFPTKPGTYRLTCAEYCGTNHAQMACLLTDPETGACLRRATVVVHEPGDYERYLADKQAESTNMPPVELGKMLYEKKGCIACHTVDGSQRVGPSWKSPDWDKMIQLNDGSSVKMDENYVKESILAPLAKSRPNYPASMPSFEGQLKPKELDGLIAYIKSLKQ